MDYLSIGKQPGDIVTYITQQRLFLDYIRYTNYSGESLV